MTGQIHIFFILKEKTLEDDRMNMLNYTRLIYIVSTYIHTRGTCEIDFCRLGAVFAQWPRWYQVTVLFTYFHLNAEDGTLGF
jgi:hypothetical protein